jgi:peptidylprolyl isomerase
MRFLPNHPLRWLCSILMLFAFGALTAGCGSSDAAAVPTVVGDFGADPVITMPNGDPPGDLVVRTLIQGNGPVVQDSDFVLLYVEGKVWAGDREIYDSYTNREPQDVPLSTGGVLPAWRQLAGQRVGSRVLMVVPPVDGFGSAGDPSLNVLGGDTMVFVFDLLSEVPDNATAHGTVVPYQARPGMPQVTGADSSDPKITVPSKAKPPGKLVVTMLMRGSGPKILSGQTVVVQDTGSVWRTGKVFDSSWTQKYPDAFIMGQGQVVPGWEEALGGLPVGSRVLLTVPPSLAYGNQAIPPDINDNDTLVFIIDILAAYTPVTT